MIPSDVRLSLTISIFTGESTCDLILTLGLSYTTDFLSNWSFVDCVKYSNKLSFKFPNYQEQKTIANEFDKKSCAGFNNIKGSLDRILI